MTEPRPIEALRDLTDGGPDFVFEAIGRPATVELAIESLPLGGTAVLVGMTPVEARASFAVYPFVDGSRRILGSNYGFADPPRRLPALRRAPSCRPAARRAADRPPASGSTTWKPPSIDCAPATACARSSSSTERDAGPPPRPGRGRPARRRRLSGRRHAAPSGARTGGSGSSIGGSSSFPVISRAPRPWVRNVHAQRTRTTIRFEKPIR